MRRKLVWVIALSILIVLGAGCEKSSPVEISEIKIQNADSKVQEFVNRFSNQNDIYLFTNEKQEKYLFLNGYNVVEGKEAPYFSDTKVELDDDTLTVYFNEKYTNSYSNKELSNRLLYRIRVDKQYEYIRIFKNGEETHFDVVGG
jgi:flagellar basal body L-ring protein FlgH